MGLFLFFIFSLKLESRSHAFLVMLLQVIAAAAAAEAVRLERLEAPKSQGKSAKGGVHVCVVCVREER